MVWLDDGCLFAADCKYAARRRYNAERVAIAYGDCVRRLQSIDVQPFSLCIVFTAAFAVL